MTTIGQQNAVGKALWNQVTAIVILYQNMCQSTQSVKDGQLRTALENMCYTACTKNDIKFLQSRIADKCTGHPDMSSTEFRNVSIITGLNAEKDHLNELESKHFAEDRAEPYIFLFSRLIRCKH
jgi:hypothetical protein